MPNSDFDNFVKKMTTEKEMVEKEVFDPEQQLQEWKRFLSEFYQKVESYLKEYIDSGDIEIVSKGKTISEEFYGEYEVESKSILIGNTKVLLDPIGTMLIGAKGRVDMKGRREIRRFVLVDNKSTKPHFNISIIMNGETPPLPPVSAERVEWAWKLTSMPPKVHYFDLTQESFREALLAVADV